MNALLSALDAPAQDVFENALRKVERPLLMEKSVKAIGSQWRDRRFLISFPRPALAPAGRKHLLWLGRQLGAPEDALALLIAEYSRALSVHVGYEPEPGGPVYKLYLEFSHDSAPEPDLVFRAIKWRSDTWVQSRYWHCVPSDFQTVITEHVPKSSVRAILVQLAGIASFSPRLMWVEEAHSPRRSVDLNIANSGRTVADLRDYLRSAFGTEKADQYLDQHARDEVGHLAAGTARDGQAFATLYHGARFVTGTLP